MVVEWFKTEIKDLFLISSKHMDCNETFTLEVPGCSLVQREVKVASVSWTGANSSTTLQSVLTTSSHKHLSVSMYPSLYIVPVLSHLFSWTSAGNFPLGWTTETPQRAPCSLYPNVYHLLNYVFNKEWWVMIFPFYSFTHHYAIKMHIML